jgi:hypothetical protein
MKVPISTTHSTSQRRKSVIACLAVSNDALFTQERINMVSARGFISPGFDSSGLHNCTANGALHVADARAAAEWLAPASGNFGA